MKNVTKLVCLSVIGLFAAGDSNAWAALDAKILPGYACKRASGGTKKFEKGRIVNNGDSEMVVVCPVVRDMPTGDISSAKVWAIDLAGDFNVKCSFASRSPDGNTAGWSASKTTDAGTSPDCKPMNFVAATVGDNDIYFLSCTLPTKSPQGTSGLCGYKVVETGTSPQ